MCTEIKGSIEVNVINSRCREILQKILDSPDYISAAELSRKLELSPRQIRYSCQKINSWLEDRGVVFAVKPGMGFSLEVTDCKKAQLRKELKANKWTIENLTPQERLYWIILTLLDKDQPIVAKQFSRQLKISRTTATRDLSIAKEWFHAHGLKLFTRQNYGSVVEGSEVDKRAAFSDCLLEAVGEIKFLTLLERLESSSTFHGAYDICANWIWTSFLKELELNHFVRLVNQIICSNDIQFSDRSYVQLVLGLAVLLRRLQQGRGLADFQIDSNQWVGQKEIRIARMIAGDIRGFFKIDLTKAEVCYVEDLLRDLITPGADRMLSNRTTLLLEEEKIIDFVDKLMANCIKYLHPSLMMNDELSDDLIKHLKNTLVSGNTVYAEKAVLTEEIKEEFPFVYRVVNGTAEECCRKFEILDLTQEVGFLTMHLAAAMESLQTSSARKRKIIVVCNSGVATTKLLVARLKAEFPEVEVVGSMSYLEFMRQEKPPYDLVIGTIPIESEHKPSLIVNPLLSDRDIKRIRAALRTAGNVEPFTDSLDPPPQGQNISLASLLHASNIELQISAQHWCEVVDKAGNILVGNRAINPSYIKAIKEILRTYGPYMVIMPGVALLHAYPEDGVNRLSMSLVTLRTPVDFKHESYDPVFLAIVLGATDNKSHLRALSELADMLHNRETLEILQNTYHKTRILHEISKYSQKQEVEA